MVAKQYAFYHKEENVISVVYEFSYHSFFTSAKLIEMCAGGENEARTVSLLPSLTPRS